MFFNWQNVNFESDSLLLFQNLKSSIPSAVYALQGFTIVIHIGHLIKRPENLLKILLLATLTAALLCISFQAVVFASIGKIATSNTMATFVSHIGITSPVFKFLLNNIINIAYLSSSFMIITGNSWNLFALAKNGFIPGKEILLTQVNNAPAYCLLLHSVVSIGFIIVCQNIIALQAASVFAAFCTYLLCSIAAFKNFFKQKSLFSLFGLLAIINCLFILYSSLKLIIQFGLSYEFVILFSLGLAMLIWKFFSKNSSDENLSLN
jgi:amino acid transporter